MKETDVQAWDINLCSPTCSLIAGHIGDHEQKRPIDTFCLRNLFCFRPLGHEGDCVPRSSADGMGY